ncbi:MAG: class I SAM-dependent methyltransferase [Chloroflexota bacterium]
MGPVSSAPDGPRRGRPRPWDTDWLILRGLRDEIARLVGHVARPGLVALDFGCGDRPYESVFETHGVEYVGADFGGNPDIAIAPDGTLAAPDAEYDLLLSFQVLEHVRDLDTYFAEARRVLRPDGQMLLSTHGTWLYHPHPEDHRRWTREGLLAEIAAHGFKVIECRPVVGPMAWTTIIRNTGIAQFLRVVPGIGRGVAAVATLIANARARLEDAITPAGITADNACVYVTLSRLLPADGR